MKQAASIKDLELGGLLPGINVNTSASDFEPISSVQLIRFKGEKWELFGAPDTECKDCKSGCRCTGGCVCKEDCCPK